MPFTRSVDPDPAPGPLADLFAADRRAWGYLPNLATTFGVRPAVYAAWRQLNGAIKAGMSPRRYELATLAAAVELRSSYCSLAHGKVLAAEHLSEDQVVAITEGDTAGLSAEDAVVVRLATKVARDAPAVTDDDLEPLRAAGLGDDDIFDVILAAAARCFFSTVLDATGTEPDAAFEDLPDRLRDALTVGRPRAVGAR
jgi:alkylhydroperoxidase family enzyme